MCYSHRPPNTGALGSNLVHGLLFVQFLHGVGKDEVLGPI